MLELLMTGKVDKYPDSGPGPKNLKFGDTDAGYFGVVSQSELFTAAEIISAITLSVIQRADANMVWCKFYWKNKVVYFPSQFLFNDNTWNAFATKNIVYSNATTRTISKTFSGVQRKFKIRMPAGSTVDPALLTVSPSAEFFALYAKVFARSVINAGWATGVWDSLVEPVARINKYTPTQTTFSTDTNQALWVTYTGSLVNALKSTDPNQGDRGFMPVLELVNLTAGGETLLNSFTRSDGGVAGYYGQVTQNDLITMTDLLTVTGVPEQFTRINLDAGWLKFAVDDKIIYIAKKAILAGVTRNNIAGLNLLKGNKQITIKGKTYIVRCPTGTTYEPASVPAPTDRSEWERLMYSVHASAITGQQVTNGVKWDQLTYGDLGMASSQGSRTLALNDFNGGAAWRGSANDMTTFAGMDYNTSDMTCGWRPVLELVG